MRRCRADVPNRCCHLTSRVDRRAFEGGQAANRNSRASLAKWQTADPLGYPDGWNALAYCNNGVTGAVDLWGCKTSKSNMHPVDPAEVESTLAEIGKKMALLNSQGWRINEPIDINTFELYCNEEKIATKGCEL